MHRTAPRGKMAALVENMSHPKLLAQLCAFTTVQNLACIDSPAPASPMGIALFPL